jgi:branched-chain amino acid transport system substrate-binding protein
MQMNAAVNRRRVSRERLRMAALAVGALALVTACGGGGAASFSDDEGPLVIGLSVSKTGPLQKSGQDVENGYQLWADDVNERGGILGRDVELKVYDDQSDPSVGVRLYTKLITEDKVDMVLGPFSSGVTAPVAAYVDRQGYPLLTGGASAAEIWTHGYENVFGVYASGKAQNESLLQVASDLGAKTMAVLNEASPFGRDTGNTAVELAPDFGLEVVAQEEYPPGATDFGGLVTKLERTNAEFLLAGTYYDQATILAETLASADVKFPVFAETIGPESQDFIKAVGDAAEGILGVAHWAPGVSTSGSAEFEEAYDAAHGGEPAYQVAMAYATGQILEAAIIEADSFDHAAVRDVLAEFTTTTIAGTYEVDETGFQVGKEPFITQVQDGEPVVVYPEEYAVGEVRSTE